MTITLTPEQAREVIVEAFKAGVECQIRESIPYYALVHLQRGKRYAADVVRRLVEQQTDLAPIQPITTKLAEVHDIDESPQEPKLRMEMQQRKEPS
jgi:predicted CopG family antitoxin